MYGMVRYTTLYYTVLLSHSLTHSQAVNGVNVAGRPHSYILDTIKSNENEVELLLLCRNVNGWLRLLCLNCAIYRVGSHYILHICVLLQLLRIIIKQYVGSRRVLSELLRLTDLNGPTVCDVSHLLVFVCFIVITMV